MLLGLVGLGERTARAAEPNPPAIPLSGRVVAVGILGASAISPVGVFHSGGQLRDDPALSAFTEPGRVLDPGRLLVASSSNFGAPPAQPDRPPGAILSIDPRAGERLTVPSDFAAAGDQASARQGAVQLFTAQSPAFVNRVYNPRAGTADLPAVSNPRGISLNQAFGRPWFANAPWGATGPGTLTSVDPDGRPRTSAPSSAAGGVFAGEQTNRSPQLIPGALVGSVGTAFLGRSPDGPRRGVYAVVNADGSLVQINVEDGVDGLAPPGTIGPLENVHGDPANPTQAGAARTGLAFNWVPNQILYVADPVHSAVVALSLVDDGLIFRVLDVRRLESSRLNVPIDLAPAVPEVVSPIFASNTTLAGGADLYVANRGDGTIVRLRQDGTVLAVRQVELPGLGPLGPGRLNGIAVSPDAQKIYLTVSGSLDGSPETEGALVELAAFAAPLSDEAAPPGSSDSASPAAELVARGEALFRTELTPEQGLGPLYNARSCLGCHGSPTAGGMGGEGLGIVTRVGRLADGAIDPLSGRGGPIARAHSVAELGLPCRLTPGIPPEANLVSLRNAPALFGLGLLDAIPDEVILAGAIPRGDGVQGRANLVPGPDGGERVGRFGWKADTPSLELFVAEALRNEHGITSPLAPNDLTPPVREGEARCAGEADGPEDDGSLPAALTAYVRSLDPPAPPVAGGSPSGEAIFRSAGCAACHTPSLWAGSREVRLYSDLLLHDLGPVLDDGLPQGQARGRDWRTAPLWGLSSRARYLHDGRARSLRAAILAHGGEAQASIDRFRQLSPAELDALTSFLASL